MRCAYFDAGVCRSCELMGVPYPTQLVMKEESAHRLLAAHPDADWLASATSEESGFRATAKMVVGGTVDDPTLGILDTGRHGVDLRNCGLHPDVIRTALPAIAGFITAARLEPYDVPRRRGELKYVLLVQAPDGGLLLRFVLRSTEAETRIRKHLPDLLAAVPSARVVSLNIQPEHKAVIEGEREIVLTAQSALPMRVGDVELLVRPGSFVQTNTGIATQLYAQARAWADELAPSSVWDLYCGVGGFALSVSAPGRSVLGVEVSPEAIDSARSAAVAADLEHARFEVGDATAFAVASAPEDRPDLVIVNPPRRGIGETLSTWLQESGPRAVLYSSCNAVTLAKDLERMPAYRVERARLFDMFPQTHHSEVMVLMRRD
jgi:23S rRNA (uracil747-C5)-methyltransferase